LTRAARNQRINRQVRDPAAPQTKGFHAAPFDKQLLPQILEKEPMLERMGSDHSRTMPQGIR
jgi:hypothetical protein